MAEHTPWGPRPGKSQRAYMERQWAEAAARTAARACAEAVARGEEVAPLPVAPVVPAPTDASAAAAAAAYAPPPPVVEPDPELSDDEEPLSFDDEELAEIQAANSARVAAIEAEDERGPAGANWFNEPGRNFSAVADAMPAAGRMKARNPPVHRAQIKPIPGEIDKEGFIRFVRKLPGIPKVSRKTRTAVARTLAWGLGKARTLEEAVRGVAQLSYESLASGAECSRAQVWRVIRAFEQFGILDTFNVLERDENGALRRAPNAYVLRGFTKAVPVLKDAVKSAISGAYERLDEQVRRFCAVWDMRANHLGLRRAPTTPSLRPRQRPAPS